jgi:hypothetical protein
MSWESLWNIFVAFLFVAYLLLLFHIISDLLRDKDLHGAWKALWIFCLFIAPLVSALVYIILRGRGMALRSEERRQAGIDETEKYIREVVGAPAPTQQIESAQRLLAEGHISQAEFDRLKALALA